MPAELDTLLQNRLHTLRLACGFSAANLDQRCGFYVGTTRRLERGQQRIFASHLYMVAKATGAPISYFYDEDAVIETPHNAHHLSEEIERFVETFLRIDDPALKQGVCDLVELLASKSEVFAD